MHPLLQLGSEWRRVLLGDGARKEAAGVEQYVLVRGERPTRWEPQEEGMMSVAASFPSVKKPRFNVDQERRDNDD
jgi:hypothetical protein